MSMIIFLALLSCAGFTFSLPEVRKHDHGGSRNHGHHGDHGDCGTGLCTHIIDGFNLELFEEPTHINNVNVEDCCVVCALLGGCKAWNLEIDESNQVQHSSVCVAKYHFHVNLTRDFFDYVEFEQENTFGQIINRSEINIDCWKIDGLKILGWPFHHKHANSFDECCDKCKNYKGEPVAFFIFGTPLYCAYFTFDKTYNSCRIFDVYQIHDTTPESNHQSGFLALESQEKCHVQNEYSYSGTNLFGGEPVYPVTPAMCCSLCKTTAGCKAWTWFFETNAEYRYLYFLHWRWRSHHVRGICFLKSEKGHVISDELAISGYL